MCGAADAVALEPDGTVSLVIDWKSDVVPTPEAKKRYRIQIGDYLASTNASQGLLVFLTTGEVEAVVNRH